MTHLINDIYAIEVPEGATGFFFDGGLSIGFYLEGELRFSHLPSPGNWQLICTTKECTELKAACIVDSDGNGWQDYDKANIPSCYPFTSSMESLRSLLTSKKLDPNKNYVLIKKVS